MPAIQRSEFALALNQVANERGIDPEIVLDTVKNAIVAAYRKDHPDIVVEEYSATLDSNSGEAKIFHNEEDVTPPGFGRIAAQTAKQVILQKIREKEKEAIITDYKVRIGTVVNGMVLRFAGPNIIVDIGKAEGIMPPMEQIANEKYHLNQRLAVYLSEIREGLKGEEIIVSRASTGLLEGLLKREVPEVAQGSVEVKAIVREAGNRAKIAVFSNQSGIDPVGSCVGQKGVRVELNEKEKSAHVFVPLDELSLAIGKEGQNVRLASKLTGYNLEIEEDKTVAPKKEPKEKAKEEKEQKTEKIKVETAEDKVETSEDKVEASSVETASETVETVETEENKNEGS